MASGVKAIVTGDKELDALLRGMPLAMQKKLSRGATRRSAKEIVLPAARAAVAVDSGELEESLKVRALARSRTRFGHIVTTGDGLGTGDTYYGASLELGTKERTQKTTGRTTGAITPHKFAFLRPAVYDNADRIRAEYVKDVLEVCRSQKAK